MNKNEWFTFCFISFSIVAVCCVLIGACMYCDWLHAIKLYNAGLIHESSLEWRKIVCYEPAIHTMGAGIILGVIDIAFFAITKAIKNGKDS